METPRMRRTTTTFIERNSFRSCNTM